MVCAGVLGSLHVYEKYACIEGEHLEHIFVKAGGRRGGWCRGQARLDWMELELERAAARSGC